MLGETTTATRRGTIVGPVLLVLAIAAPVYPDLLWFDETDAGHGYASFHALQSAYDEFLGATDGLIGFHDLKPGTQLAGQYADRFGVTFLNTANGRNVAWSGVWPAGGDIVEQVTGYDGTYMPAGDAVYAKFDNHLKDTPFTIVFADPVARVGAFLGMGVEGKVHSLTISVYDAQRQLLGQKTVASWLWEKNSHQQNYETFFALSAATPAITRVEIRNDSATDFANGLLIDNVAFSSVVVPESGTVVMLVLGAGLLRICQRSQIGMR